MSFLSQLTSPVDLETLATSTQILTSIPEELTTENVTTAAQIASKLLLSPNTTEVQTEGGKTPGGLYYKASSLCELAQQTLKSLSDIMSITKVSFLQAFCFRLYARFL